jgi:outer membrane protein OmpA-like peptidoglycan-associated protein
MLTVVLFVHPIALWANSCEVARQRYDDAVAATDYQQKIVLYRQAVTLCPTYAEAHNNLADALEHVGQYDDAVAVYRDAITLQPHLAVAYFGMGDTYLRMGLSEAAVAAYESGLRLQPNDRLARQGLRLAQRGIPVVEQSMVMDAETIIHTLQDDTIPTMGIRGVRGQQSRLRFNNILFEFDSAQLRPEVLPQLNELGRALTSPALQGRRIYIEGYTDNKGSADYNERLAYKRAEAVKRYVQQKFSVRDQALQVRAYGERRPLADNSTAAGRARNRRVEIVTMQSDEIQEAR